MQPREFKTVLVIFGMRDNRCRERIARALESVDGVCEVSVSLMRAEAVVVHAADCESVELVDAVTRVGYVALHSGRRAPR